jgi:hypothetical protein
VIFRPSRCREKDLRHGVRQLPCPCRPSQGAPRRTLPVRAHCVLPRKGVQIRLFRIA